MMAGALYSLKGMMENLNRFLVCRIWFWLHLSQLPPLASIHLANHWKPTGMSMVLLIVGSG